MRGTYRVSHDDSKVYQFLNFFFFLSDSQGYRSQLFVLKPNGKVLMKKIPKNNFIFNRFVDIRYFPGPFFQTLRLFMSADLVIFNMFFLLVYVLHIMVFL